MISYLAGKLTGFILNNGKKSKTQYAEVYHYGMEVLLSSFLNIFWILLIGAATHSFSSSIVFLICFILLRQCTGGWHASSHFMCNAVSCFTYLSILLISQITENILTLPAAVFLLGICFLLTVRFAPVEHPNKKIQNKKKMKCFSCISFLLFSFIALFCSFFNKTFFTLLTFTLIAVTFAMLVKKPHNQTK